MEYIYSALLLHTAGKDITAESIGKVLKSAGIKVKDPKVKALVASLEGVNLDELLKQPMPAVAAAPVAPAAAAETPAEPKKKEKKEEEKEVSEEEAAEGLGALFG